MKKTINIDKWELAFNFDKVTKELLENENELSYQSFILKRIIGQSNYKNYFEIYFNNNLFGFLYFGSYRLNRSKLYIQVLNEMLYTNNLFLLNDIQSKLNLEFYSNSKLDLALDFDYNIINRFYRILKNKDYDFIILNKKYGYEDEIGELLNISNGSRKNINKNKSFYINNKEKGLSLHSYNKLKEIEDNNNEKYYIKEYLNYEQIYRLEIRTNHNLLLDTLKKIGFTDFYIYQCIINKTIDELYYLYIELLFRIIRVKYNNKIYSLLELI